MSKTWPLPFPWVDVTDDFTGRFGIGCPNWSLEVTVVVGGKADWGPEVAVPEYRFSYCFTQFYLQSSFLSLTKIFVDIWPLLKYNFLWF